MTTRAKTRFTHSHWKEQTYSEEEGAKLTDTEVRYTYQGDLAGESVLHYLMTYRADATGHGSGFERVKGALLGRRGSFVLEHRFYFDKTGVRGLLEVVPGSGTEDLRGLRGSGVLDLAGHSDDGYPLALDVDFD
jgi:Protein of unknown function (DUF3224)